MGIVIVLNVFKLSLLFDPLINMRKPHIAQEKSIKFAKETEAKTDIKFETVIKECLDVEGSVVCTLRDPQNLKHHWLKSYRIRCIPIYCKKCSNPKLKTKKRLLPYLLCFPRPSTIQNTQQHKANSFSFFLFTKSKRSVSKLRS